MPAGALRKKTPLAPVAMPSTRRSAGSPRKRTAEVVAAAAAVFASRGFHGATTQDIADRLNIRQATLYYYFPSKEVALELVCQIGVEGFIERALAAAEAKQPVRDRLAAIIEAHLGAIDDRPTFVRTFLNERQYLPEAARKRVRRLSRRYERIIQQTIEAGMASGELRADLDSRFVALALLALCNAAAAWHGKGPGATVASINRAFGGLLFDGICAPSPTAGRLRSPASMRGSGRRAVAA